MLSVGAKRKTLFSPYKEILLLAWPLGIFVRMLFDPVFEGGTDGTQYLYTYLRLTVILITGHNLLSFLAIAMIPELRQWRRERDAAHGVPIFASSLAVAAIMTVVYFVLWSRHRESIP